MHSLQMYAVREGLATRLITLFRGLLQNEHLSSVGSLPLVFRPNMLTMLSLNGNTFPQAPALSELKFRNGWVPRDSVEPGRIQGLCWSSRQGPPMLAVSGDCGEIYTRIGTQLNCAK